MSHQWMIAAAGVAAVACWIVAGVFFAFSDFIMRSLGRLPAAEGMAAMQAINAVVYRSLFLFSFMGLALVGAAFAGWWLLLGAGAAGAWLLGGSVIYLSGVFAVTAAANVPRNNRLAAISADAPDAADRWREYRIEWTRWNHVRTVASVAAALCFSMAFVTA